MKIKIKYKHYVPFEWIQQFDNTIQGHGLTTLVEEDKEEFFNFTGPEIADIIILIQDWLLAPALYDVFKNGVITLYQKLRGLNIPPKSQKAENGLFIPKIKLKYKIGKKRRLEFKIEGIEDEEKIDSIISTAFEKIKSKETVDVFKDSRYVANDMGVKNVIYFYNKETNLWEPNDFEKGRKEWQEIIKRAKDLSS